MNKARVFVSCACGMVLIFVIIFLSIEYKNPSQFQEFVFRVVLSLASFGFIAGVPEFFHIRLTPFFHFGGSAIVGGCIYFLNPTGLVDNIRSKQIDKLISTADSAISTNQYHVAFDKYMEASKIDPRNWRPVAGLGRAAYMIGNYPEALVYFRKALALPNAEPRVYQGMALAEEGMGQVENAYEDINKYIDQSSPADKNYADAVFTRGQLLFILYYLKRDNNLVTKSIKDFEDFIMLGGHPTQWAYYHLICLTSIRSAQSNMSLDPEINSLIASARAAFSAYQGETKQYHQFLLEKLLSDAPPRDLRPGDPVRCSGLRPGVLKHLRERLAASE